MVMIRSKDLIEIAQFSTIPNCTGSVQQSTEKKHRVLKAGKVK